MSARAGIPRTALGDLVDVLSGFAFKSEEFATTGSFPMIRIRDVKRGYSETFYSGAFDNRYLVNDGDLLVGMDGEFNRERWAGGRALLNQRVCKISPRLRELSADYLYYFLPEALREIEDKTPFATVKHLSAKDIQGIQIPLPPLDEQRRIAAILDKADALRRKRKRALELLDSLTQSIFLEMFGDPQVAKFDNFRPLSEVVKAIDYGVTASANVDAVGPRFLRITDIQNGAVDWKAVPFCEAPISKLKAARLSNGDIVFARTGATTGKSFLIDSLAEETVFASYLIRVSTGRSLIPEWLFHYFQTDFYWSYIKKNARGAAQGGVNATSLGNLPILIIPTEVQRRFSLIAREVASKKRDFLFNSTKFDTLFTSLQSRAFSGQL